MQRTCPGAVRKVENMAQWISRIVAWFMPATRRR